MHESTIIVTKEKPTQELIDKIMFPFQEYWGHCPPPELVPYLKFDDETKEIENEYNNGTRTFYSKNGYIYNGMEERFLQQKQLLSGEYVLDYCYSGYREIKVPYKQLYDFSEFREQVYGKSYDGVAHSYGWWTNPNEKWDYYDVMGRYRGSIESKNPIFLQEGESEILKEMIDSTDNTCNASKIKDIINFEEIDSYSIIIDGEWLSENMMEQKVKDILKELDKEWYITIIDVHS